MANSIPDKALGNHLDSRHVRKMPDASKEPIFSDFASLIEQAVRYQNVSFYHELSEKMQWALAIAALRENKTLAIDAEYEGFNELLAEVFENHGSQDSLQKLYHYLVGIIVEGNKQYNAQVAYCIDNALEKEEDKQAFYEKYFSHEYEADYWEKEVAHG